MTGRHEFIQLVANPVLLSSGQILDARDYGFSLHLPSSSFRGRALQYKRRGPGSFARPALRGPILLESLGARPARLDAAAILVLGVIATAGWTGDGGRGRHLRLHCRCGVPPVERQRHRNPAFVCCEMTVRYPRISEMSMWRLIHHSISRSNARPRPPPPRDGRRRAAHTPRGRPGVSSPDS